MTDRALAGAIVILAVASLGYASDGAKMLCALLIVCLAVVGLAKARR